ncbi:choice-of-anchor U domain-containing protein [Thermodesulfobacteriota bacterium]
MYNANEGWHAYAGATFSRNRRSVTLNFDDGGMGDADGVVNGIIVNP